MKQSIGLRARASRALAIVLVAAAVLSACAIDTGEPETDHDEPEDFIVDPDDGKADGVPPVFDANNVVGDDVLTGSDQMTVAEVQGFLAASPYGTRSWLASYEENGMSAAEILVEAAAAHDINPLVLLARAQVETSLVSKTTRPSTHLINRALGCGCPDGRACNTAYSGLRKQLDCGARILRKWYDASIDGTGFWRKGLAKNTLDPRRVTPANHATASLYAYTPWVLVGRGGNWLAWNVTRKYVRHAQAKGYLGDTP